ncbi:27.1 kDa [Spodoptera frugiperda ascovirus 1a]|uniref:27.1 kDa n=1 Tax=Spodoptera frugiperda ascovirus 1a TaxID=113370 RepID=Q0E533_SFAVA|nr:27.1 kDa [Spodoptera frugiperda ascovirus 1a]CAL44668.1 27.1 kDa [Spodoptera frugiperda ascovirus 1a]
MAPSYDSQKCNECSSKRHANWLFSHVNHVIDTMDETCTLTVLKSFFEVVTASTSHYHRDDTLRILHDTVRLTMQHERVYRSRATILAPINAYLSIGRNLINSLSLLSSVASGVDETRALLTAARCGEAFLKIVFDHSRTIHDFAAEMAASHDRTVSSFGDELLSGTDDTRIDNLMDLPSFCVFRKTMTIEFGYDENNTLTGEVVHAGCDPNNYVCSSQTFTIDGRSRSVRIVDKYTVAKKPC